MLVNVNEGKNKKQVKDDIVLLRIPRRAPLIKDFTNFFVRMCSTRVNFRPARALNPWADAPGGRAGTKRNTPMLTSPVERAGSSGPAEAKQVGE